MRSRLNVEIHSKCYPNWFTQDFINYLVMVIMHIHLAKGNTFYLEIKHHNEICCIGQNLPYSSRKLSNIDMIWHMWYLHLWHQPTFWGIFRRKLGPVSHTALISTGIRKVQSPASAAMKRSFITVSKLNNTPCSAVLHESRCGYFSWKRTGPVDEFMVNKFIQSPRKARLKTTQELMILGLTFPLFLKFKI